MSRSLKVVRAVAPSGESTVRIGLPLVDDYLKFVAARARRETLLATAFDLKVFFSWCGKRPAVVTTKDVVAFVAEQRRGTSKVVAIGDGGSGLSSRTVARRLSSLSGLYAYLLARGDAGVRANPVPRGLATRRARRSGGRGAPLIRTPRTLPRILPADEVDALIGALRTDRDRAMVDAMLLGGLRRNEVLGLQFEDLHPGERRVFIADGKGGHQRLIPMADRFFATVGRYLDSERPPDASTDRVFVVLKGPRRGEPLSAYGLDEILDGARARAGLDHGTCHQLRHTCFTRLREAGMALEAVQAQAGHASIETTRIYLQLGDRWLAEEYRKAADAIDAQVLGDVAVAR
jgi:site-specific recombinase XerD